MWKPWQRICLKPQHRHYSRRQDIREYRLTVARLRILNLLALGWSNAEIARETKYSIHAVKNQLTQIYDILDVRNRTEAVKVAKEHGFID